MSLRTLSEVIEKLNKDDTQDQEELLKAIQQRTPGWEAYYTARCNLRDEIVTMLKAVDSI